MKRNRPGGIGLSKSYMPFILTGAGIITLIIFIFILMPGEDTSDTVRGLQTRLANLENRIMSLENQVNDRRERLESVQQSVRMLSERFGRLEAVPTEIQAIQQKLEHIDQRQGNLEKKIAEAKAPDPGGEPSAKVSQKTQSKTPAVSKKSQTRQHTVVEGDTLYSIARQYDLNVDQLRRMNNLSADAVIRPGQKLTVAQ
jgi:LysM repeat protein